MKAVKVLVITAMLVMMGRLIEYTVEFAGQPRWFMYIGGFIFGLGWGQFAEALWFAPSRRGESDD